MGGKPKIAQEDPAVARLRARQFQDLARLDEEQNTRIKRLMNAGYGRRAFKGSVDTRLAPGDTPAAPPPAPDMRAMAPAPPDRAASNMIRRPVSRVFGNLRSNASYARNNATSFMRKPA